MIKEEVISKMQAQIVGEKINQKIPFLDGLTDTLKTCNTLIFNLFMNIQKS